MLNGSNFDLGGVALPDPLHRFPAARHVQPKLPIVFAGRHFGVVPALLRFVLKKFAFVHCGTKTKAPIQRASTSR
jgi:hypothetical protein